MRQSVTILLFEKNVFQVYCSQHFRSFCTSQQFVNFLPAFIFIMNRKYTPEMVFLHTINNHNAHIWKIESQ